MAQNVKYWIACSGGVDSVVLVHLFSILKKSFGILHCNFQLRGEDSDKDEDFVKSLAKDLNVPILCKRFDTSLYRAKNKVNTQLAARELRYTWFSDIITETTAKICLAHHKDDQIETFLLQLRRGGKVKGLSGMPLVKNDFIRPLLNFTKSELVELAKKNSWKWREDISNQSNDYKRNLYRNGLLPNLKAEDLSSIQKLVGNFQELLDHFKNWDLGFLNEYGALEFEVERWVKYPYWLKQYVISNNNLGKFPVHEIDKLCNSESGASFQHEHSSVWKWRNKLAFYEKDTLKFKIKFNIVKNRSIEFAKDSLYLDASKVDGVLRLREQLIEDRITPLGTVKSKTISRYLKDKNVPPYVRKEIYILTDDSNSVLGVHNLGIEDNYKIEKNTKYVYAVSVLDA